MGRAFKSFNLPRRARHTDTVKAGCRRRARRTPRALPEMGLWGRLHTAPEAQTERHHATRLGGRRDKQSPATLPLLLGPR